MAEREALKQIFVTDAIPTQEDFHSLIDTVGEKGERGEKGETGAKGDKGDTGDAGTNGTDGADGQDGVDGFPTEEQWNELVSRVEALESPE